ncbi:MAG: alpha/beta hydrolase fold domain-containing protein [Myxococcota bacterium]
MTAATFFLAMSVFGLLLSIQTYFRLRLFAVQMVPTFLVGWFRGELAMQTLALEALVTGAFVAKGVLSTTAGQFGMAITLVSWTLLILSHRRGVNAGAEVDAALAPAGLVAGKGVGFFHGFWKPFGFSHPSVRRVTDIEYGESLPGDKGGRNLLDLYLPQAGTPEDRRPVLLQVHGGAWLIGDKREQGKPLMNHLTARGWICVAMNYRLSPQGTMPDHIVDVKRALAWIREHIAEYGGDPEFICITGGSAGGHLSSLAALTANDAAFQPGFESVDTRVKACVPVYGVYDFLDRAGLRSLGSMAEAIGPQVFKCTPEENPELWDSVCPIERVHSDAPPFFIVQGSHDSLVYAEEAVQFANALEAKSNQPVLRVEHLGAQHAFEVFHSPRSAHFVRGATAFLENIRAEHQQDQPTY